MAEWKSDRITVQAEMTLDFPMADIWPQLCPVREYDWIETWDCEVLHTESGFNELGCVFRTDFPTEGEEVWLTSRFDPLTRLEFVRTGRDRIIHFVIEAEETGGGSRLTWTQRVTGLTDKGNDYVRAKPETFAVQMKLLEERLDHYLATGTMLKA